MTYRCRYSLISVFVAATIAAPARVLALNPLTNEERPVRVMADASRNVSVIGGMVWYDTDPATHGIRYPAGVYVLEAEDADYLYFRSPAPLELRVFKSGKMIDGREIPGGLMLSKHTLSLIPGAGYIDDTDSKKLMIWKLGGNFLRLKGKSWKASF